MLGTYKLRWNKSEPITPLQLMSCRTPVSIPKLHLYRQIAQHCAMSELPI